MVVPGSKKHFCEKLVMIGTWEGMDSTDQLTSGPIVQCSECGIKFRMIQERWERIPKENKTVMTKKEEKQFA